MGVPIDFGGRSEWMGAPIDFGGRSEWMGGCRGRLREEEG